MQPSSARALLPVLETCAQTIPEQNVFTYVNADGVETTSLTYEHLWHKTGLVADLLLQKKDLVKGDRVILSYPFGLDLLVGMFGCMRAGFVPCLVDTPSLAKLSTDLPIFMAKTREIGAKHVMSTARFRRAMRACERTMPSEARQEASSSDVLTWITTDRLRERKTSNRHLVRQSPVADDSNNNNNNSLSSSFVVRKKQQRVKRGGSLYQGGSFLRMASQQDVVRHCLQAIYASRPSTLLAPTALLDDINDENDDDYNNSNETDNNNKNEDPVTTARCFGLYRQEPNDGENNVDDTMLSHTNETIIVMAA